MANPYVKQTWTDGSGGGTPLSAARMAVIEQGIFDAHLQPAARVFHDANQSIVTATLSTLSFNQERYDQDGLGTSTMHDNATNNSRLTAKVAGKYRISANISFAANATGYRRVFLRINAGDLIAATSAPANSVSMDTYLVCACDYDLAVNDYIEVRVEQNSGGNLNVVAASKYSPEFSMHRIG